jgi:putative DNA primase/helicase
VSQLDRLPADLRDRRQWVVWRWELRDGKPTKVPYRVAEPHVCASTTDPSTWGTFDRAVAVEGVDGIGYVFARDDPFIGIDLDGCIVNGAMHPEAARVVAELGSYTEVSPSRTGVHVIVRGKLHGTRHRTSQTPWGGGLEVYAEARYFTMTGQGEGVIDERQAQLDEVVHELLSTPVSAPQAANGHAGVVAEVDDDELLARARSAKNGRAFSALYRGDHSAYGSPSDADFALCGHLAFWTGGDRERMDRLFRRSGLMRAEKWDRRSGKTTYGRMTIENAVAGQTEFYYPPLCTTCGNGPGKAKIQSLLAEYEAGRLTPANVPLGELPIDVTDDARLVAEHMQLLIGLRAAVCEDRPLPYSARWAAKRLGWGTNHRRASRAIRSLCVAGVIDDAEPMPARGKPNGTKTYAPPLAVASANVDAIEHEAVAVEVRDAATGEPAPCSSGRKRHPRKWPTQASGSTTSRRSRSPP